MTNKKLIEDCLKSSQIIEDAIEKSEDNHIIMIKAAELKHIEENILKLIEALRG